MKGTCKVKKFILLNPHVYIHMLSIVAFEKMLISFLFITNNIPWRGTALRCKKAPLITKPLHKHTFHITCMKGNKKSKGRRVKWSERSSNETSNELKREKSISMQIKWLQHLSIWKNTLLPAWIIVKKGEEWK